MNSNGATTNNIQNNEIRQQGIKKRTMDRKAKEINKNDALRFPGDTSLTVNDASGIYRKLTFFDTTAKKYKLHINWGKY